MSFEEEEDQEFEERAEFPSLGAVTYGVEEGEGDSLDPLVKAERLRVQERQTFISAVSSNLGIRINDLAAVSALNTVTADYNRQQRKEAREAAKALDLEKRENDLGPMFAKVEGDLVHETMAACELSGSPRGRSATSGPGFKGPGLGSRKWRVCDVGRSGLPPHKLHPSLDRLGDFRQQGGERSGFGVPHYFSDKSKVLVDPYDVQREDLSGWRVPSPFHGGGAVPFHATFPEPKRVKAAPTSPKLAATQLLQQASKPNSSPVKKRIALTLGDPVEAEEGVDDDEGDELALAVARSGGELGSQVLALSASRSTVAVGSAPAAGSIVGAHQGTLPWFPGSDTEHRFSISWHRDHSVSESHQADGRAVTASRLQVGEAVVQRRALRAAQSRAKHLGDKEARLARRQRLKDHGERSPEESARLDALSAEIARLGQLRSIASSKRDGHVQARKDAAAKANRRIAAFTAGGGQEGGLRLEALRKAKLGSHPVGQFPLPMGTPFAYRAKDLFKTFRDDECL
mmetsp:Transcript_44419/g.82171  ORF Transcript_44419/g.82171 Transcript_44419/m.82171 type:complete len:515 (+) Transcript_44419:58-1602(+)